MTKTAKRPKALEQSLGGVGTTQVEEANVARLGLISLQERIPSDFTTWKVEIALGQRHGTLECVAPSEYGGVPHGLDNDFVLAIYDLFFEEGNLEKNELVTTPYRILTRAGLADSGHYYTALRASLFRLRSAVYTASDSWFDTRNTRWTTSTFSYIEKFSFIGRSATFGQQTELVLGLSTPIMDSIRAKYTKPLNLDFLRSLQRPSSRGLYRLLDGKRANFSHPDDVSRPQFSENLLAWGAECKFNDNSPNKIRRALQGAHEELIERGYLKEVIYLGRGGKQSITYVFEKRASVVETGLRPLTLEKLRRFGLSLGSIIELVQRYGALRVQERSQLAEQLLKNFHARNPAGFVRDVICDETGKYVDEGQAQMTTTKTPNPQAQISEDDDDFEQVFRVGTRDEQIDHVFVSMNLLIERFLNHNEIELAKSRLRLTSDDLRTVKSKLVTAWRTKDSAEFRSVLLGALEPDLEPRVSKSKRLS